MTETVRRVLVGVATVGPCGFVPRAPGTVGSVAGVALFWVVRSAHSLWLEAVVLIAVILVGVVAAFEAESKYERRDPGYIVIDEVAGMLLTLLAVPVGVGGVLIGFVAFRVFDVVKPFPARQAEALPGGWGVMVDDLVAGLYAQGALRLLLWVGALA
ncbi:MAG: phosphatidylglycerophosphatase A [bacterium]